MTPSRAVPRAPMARMSLAVACLSLALVLPLGLVLFVLRNVVAMQPTLQPVPFALDLILESGPSVLILLGIPASGLAIGLGHVALGQAGTVPAGRRARRVARTGLGLGYLALGAVITGTGFTVFWLGTHRMHLVW